MLNLNQLKELYINSPMWIKKIYGSLPYSLRNGKEYRSWKRFLEQNLDTEEYSFLKLKETVFYAYNNVPYYNRVYSEFDISPHDIKSIKDFDSLPFIDKDVVRENFDDFIVTSYPKNKTFYVTTGGSSGEPMKFLQSKNIWAKELAFGMNYFGQYGYKPSQLKASFRGGDFKDLKIGKYWKYNPVHNEIHFSPFHINKKSIFTYVNDLNYFQLKYFHTYPSSLLLLIDHMQDNNLKLNYQISAIFLISENFTVDEAERIRRFFNCKVSSFYGHTERLIFAPSFSKDLSSYKIDMRYGFFELIDRQENKIYDTNISGEIVGTSFDNWAMPLIRYKTKDYTRYINTEDNIISMIEGRSKEYILGKDALKVYLTALNVHSDIFKNVMKFQYYQNKIAEVELRLIVNKQFSDTDKTNILDALNKKVAHAISFRIKIVDDLALTKRGKFKNVIRNLDE